MSEAESGILCSSCGAGNQVPAAMEGTLTCRSCGRPLPNPARPPLRLVADNPAVGHAPAPPIRPAISRQTSFVIALGLAFGAIAGTLLFTLQQHGGFHLVADLLRPAQEPPARRPVAQTPGLVFNRSGHNVEAPFKIVTLPGANYFVKLVNRKTGADTIGIYVVGGTPIEVKVPPGSYELRVATGDAWYGEGEWFGNETQFQASHDVFDFQRTDNGTSGFTVELFDKPNGNLEMHPIRAADF